MRPLEGIVVVSLEQAVAAPLAKRHLTGAQVVERLDAAQIANARINRLAEVWSHPQLQARGPWTGVETPSGRIPALQPPGLEDARMDAVPGIGEQTEAILRELGYQEAEIAAITAGGAT